MLHVPGEEAPQFSLVRPFVPFSENDERKNLIALMAVSSDPATYGQLRVLTISSPEQIDGPAIVDSEIKRKYAADFTLESQTGSKVRLGTLQALPIGGSVLWVRPWYVQAEQTPIPQLSYVMVAFGDEVFRARTLEGAVKLAFPDSTVDFSTTRGPAGTRRAGYRYGRGHRYRRVRVGVRLGVWWRIVDHDAGRAADGRGAADGGQPPLRGGPRRARRRRTWPPTRPRSSRPSSW